MIRLAVLLISGLSLVAAVRPAPAQILGEWRLMHSDTAFDYLVTPRGFAHVSTSLDGTKVYRAVISRMLVRFVEAGRSGLIAARARAELETAGYEAYASSTYVVEVQCTRRQLVVRETADYADDGTVLDRRQTEAGGTDPSDGWITTAKQAVIAWACRQAGSRG